MERTANIVRVMKNLQLDWRLTGPAMGLGIKACRVAEMMDNLNVPHHAGRDPVSSWITAAMSSMTLRM